MRRLSRSIRRSSRVDLNSLNHSCSLWAYLCVGGSPRGWFCALPPAAGCLALQMVELDIGYVGEVTKVDPTILATMVNNGYIPVVATIATDPTGQALNINADTAAGEVRLLSGRRPHAAGLARPTVPTSSRALGRWASSPHVRRPHHM